jgi:outer membrane protein assembly factor BamB
MGGHGERERPPHSPILLPDRLILFPLPNVVALDLKTGKELWTVQVEGEAEYSTTPPAMRGTEICVGAKGVLSAIDSAAGKSTWILRTVMPDKVSFVPQPAWAGDRLLYAVGRKLMCFKLK